MKFMQKINFKQVLPHAVAIILFWIISLAYFYPQIQGKTLLQYDMKTHAGMSKEVSDYKEATGEQILWTNTMFSGMPTYLIGVTYSYNLCLNVLKIPNIFCARPANFIFVSLLGFYLSLLIFGINPWLSIAGSVAFAFSSYFFVIIDAGHSSKSAALAYMAPIIAGVYLTYNKKIILGSLLAGLFLALQLIINHLQITYYTMIVIFVYCIFQLFYSYKQKEIKKYVLATAALIVTSVLAFGSNATSIMLTYEYGKDSMRGKSELTDDKANKTSGLDRDYATGWSYGKAETLTLLIPNFMGGASSGDQLDKTSESYKLFQQSYGENALQVIKQLPCYWGDQPGTSGPVYVGAIVFFLFILGLFIVKGHLKWWLLSVTILSLMLAWGKNFMWFTNLFFDYFPGYDKFRTVTMILVIAEFAMPLLAIFALKKIINKEITKEQLMKPFKYSLIIVGSITLFFALLPGMFFDFTSPSDKGMQAEIINALVQDRESMLRSDALRSLIFVLLSAGVIYALVINKLKTGYFYVILTLLFLIDMWPVDARFMRSDAFVPRLEAKTAFKPTSADIQILKDKDPDFRVWNLSVSTFNDASTSYFHKSIGGYHGAKMKRYQELIEKHISKNNMQVINMLNTKYVIVPNKEQGPVVQQNPEALGNAWFVKSYRMVANADEEIKAIEKFSAKDEAIIDKRFTDALGGMKINFDTTATIKLTKYSPDLMTYESKSSAEQLAVFSEIYYDKGWTAYVDGAAVPHFRVNYVLRAMRVPSGIHKIEFKFQPKSYDTGNKISFASSAILLLLLLGVFVKELFFSRKSEEKQN